MAVTSSKETRRGIDVCCAKRISASFAVIFGMSKTTVGFRSPSYGGDALTVPALPAVAAQSPIHRQAMMKRLLISKPTNGNNVTMVY